MSASPCITHASQIATRHPPSSRRRLVTRLRGFGCLRGRTASPRHHAREALVSAGRPAGFGEVNRPFNYFFLSPTRRRPLVFARLNERLQGGSGGTGSVSCPRAPRQARTAPVTPPTSVSRMTETSDQFGSRERNYPHGSLRRSKTKQENNPVVLRNDARNFRSRM